MNYHLTGTFQQFSYILRHLVSLGYSYSENNTNFYIDKYICTSVIYVSAQQGGRSIYT